MSNLQLFEYYQKMLKNGNNEMKIVDNNKMMLEDSQWYFNN